MKTISIGKAFSAMLWLVEKEHSVPIDKMKGAWNFYDQKTPLQPIDYTGLINALGYNYFDKSLYQGIEDKINLTNIIDGGRILSPENELICQPKELTKVEKLEEWVNHEIDNQFFRFGHSKHQPDSEEYVCSVKETPVDKTGEISHEEELAELMAQLNNPEAKVRMKEQEAQRKEKEAENSVPKIPVSVTDQLIASTHLQLIELLKASNLQAYYYPAVAKFKDELNKPVKSTQTAKPINTAYWFLKPLPHYDVSAIHFGDAHKLYFTKHALSELGVGEHKITPYHYFWYANVKIEADSFEEFIMPLIYSYFPLPKKAVLKRTGNDFIISFGEDKEAKIKQSKGLSALLILINYSNVNYQNQAPVDAVLLHNLLSSVSELGDIERFVDATPENYDELVINNIKGQNKETNVLLNTIRRKVKLYWEADENISNIEGMAKEIIRIASKLSELTQDSSYISNIKTILNADEYSEPLRE
ncbi:MAG: hypothetical protein V5789_05155 [Colwellia sp.]